MSTRLPVRNLIPLLLCALAGAAAVHAAETRAPQSAAEPADPADPPLPAVWVSRKFSLTYMGFTSHYSCDGLRDNLRDILLQLGARKKDLELREIGCVRFNGPSIMPGVDGTFSVLVPADSPDAAKATGADATPVQARWHSVDVVRKLGYNFDLSGNCELLEQVQRQVLPLATSRNVEFRSTCTPHQATVNPVSFKLQVLVPVPVPPKAAAGSAPQG